MLVVRADGATDPNLQAGVTAVIAAEQKRLSDSGIQSPALVIGDQNRIVDDTKSNTGIYLIVAIIIYLLISKGAKNVFFK